MKHTIPLQIITGTKILYQVLMILGALLVVLGLGLVFAATPLIVFTVLGSIIFLLTYFTVKEVYSAPVNLIVEASGDELKVYRENSKGERAIKASVRASELASVKLIRMNGALGITYYCIEAKTKAKGPLNHKIIKLLSPLLDASEQDLLNILVVIQKQYPAIQLGH